MLHLSSNAAVLQANRKYGSIINYFNQVMQCSHNLLVNLQHSPDILCKIQSWWVIYYEYLTILIHSTMQLESQKRDLN